MKSRLFLEATVVFRHYIQVTSLYLEFGKENSKFIVTSFSFGLVSLWFPGIKSLSTLN